MPTPIFDPFSCAADPNYNNTSAGVNGNQNQPGSSSGRNRRRSTSQTDSGHRGRSGRGRNAANRQRPQSSQPQQTTSPKTPGSNVNRGVSNNRGRGGHRNNRQRRPQSSDAGAVCSHPPQPGRMYSQSHASLQNYAQSAAPNANSNTPTGRSSGSSSGPGYRGRQSAAGSHSNNSPSHSQRSKEGLNYKILCGMEGRTAEFIITKLHSHQDDLKRLVSNCKQEMVKILLRLFSKVCSSDELPSHLRPILNVLQQNEFLPAINRFLSERKRDPWCTLDEMSQHITDSLYIVRCMMAVMPNSTYTEIGSIMDTIKLMTDNGRYEVSIELLVDVQSTFQDIENEKNGQTEQKPRSRFDDHLDDMHYSDAPDDYKEIPVIPDIEDLNGKREIFIRTNLINKAYRSENHYLDVQYRLLREDFVQPLRLGIENLQLTGVLKKSQEYVKVYSSVRIEHHVLSDNGISHKLKFDTKPFQNIRWENSKRLLFGNLLCLSKDNFKENIHFAIVKDRKADDLSLGYITVQFVANPPDYSNNPNKDDEEYAMVETDAFFEAYKHVLFCLQKITSIPLSNYIVYCDEHMERPEYLRNFRGSLDLKSIASKSEFASLEYWPNEKELGLDSSQSAAVKLALSNELAVIQGPPGTGKTYVGLLIMKVLLNNRHIWKYEDQPGPIVVVCYTNHALDQFVEGISEFWNKPGSIVRIGGRCKSENLKQFTLIEIKKNTVFNRNVRQTSDEKEHRRAISTQKEIIKSITAGNGNTQAMLQALQSIIPKLKFLAPHIAAHLFDQFGVSADDDSKETILEWLGVNRITNKVLLDAGFVRIDIDILMACGLSKESIYEHYQQTSSVNIVEIIDCHKGTSKNIQLTKDISEKLNLIEIVPIPIFVTALEDMGDLKYSGLGVIHQYIVENMQYLSQRTMYSMTASHQTHSTDNSNALLADVDSLLKKVGFGELDIRLLTACGMTKLQIYKMQGLTRSTYIKDIMDRWMQSEAQKCVNICEGLFLTELFDKNILLLALTKVNIQQPTMPKSAHVYDFLVRNYHQLEQETLLSAPMIDGKDEVANIVQDQRRLDIDDSNKKGAKSFDKRVASKIEEMAAITHDEMIMNLPTEDKDGFKMQNSQKKKRRTQLKEELTNNKHMSDAEEKKITDIWKMEAKSKWRLYRLWMHRLRNHEIDSSPVDLMQLQSACDCLKELRWKDDENVIKKADVVAMTTTGAARIRDVINKLSSKIVVVEEAAECMEAHIVTAMPKSTEHLILIGDHQQLKPSPTVYELARHYKLDTSLFERMIGVIPHQTLEKQHRMRTDIADLLRPHIYKKLLDADNVREYSDVKGVQKSLFFVSHQKNESAVSDGKSKINYHEAEFLVAFCQYLLLQGYNPSQITILTAYTGQLLAIKKIMKNKIRQNVYVTAVDNFQGEENDIILLSLVRSNDEGRIGFLGIENRVCVALSRAKIGLFCIGNMELLAESSSLWRNIIEILQSKQCFGTALPLTCIKHEDKITRVTCANDFKKIPEGGCDQDCSDRLECGHACPRKCHPEGHEGYKCNKVCDKLCRNGLHKCRKRCYNPCGDCKNKIEKELKCGHKQTAECYLNPDDIKCEQKCTKLLNCGHQCQRTCGDDKCTDKCKARVAKVHPCGHKVSVNCFEKDNPSTCDKKCGEILMCSHKCEGDCTTCLQGRLHKTCTVPCSKLLVCGHTCTSTCSTDCPPCEKECTISCQHNKCGLLCGEPCVLCKEPCEWKCDHYKCTKLCSEVCDRPPCNKPCNKKQKCGHDCLGLCGEICPDICKDCNKTQGMGYFGYENDKDTRFIQLESCGHIFSSKNLDIWMQSTDNKHITFKLCPHADCKVPIRSKRYGRQINTALCNLNAVKMITVGSVEVRNRKFRSIHASITSTKNQLQLNKFFQGVFQSYMKILEKYRKGHRIAIHVLSIIEEQSGMLLSLTDILERGQQLYVTLPDSARNHYASWKKMVIFCAEWVKEERQSFLEEDKKNFTMISGQFNASLLYFQLLITHEDKKSLDPSNQREILLNETSQLLFGDSAKFEDFKKLTVKKNLSQLETDLKVLIPMPRAANKQPTLSSVGLNRAKWKSCPNGHIYSGDNCPHCPASAQVPKPRSMKYEKSFENENVKITITNVGIFNIICSAIVRVTDADYSFKDDFSQKLKEKCGDELESDCAYSLPISHEVKFTSSFKLQTCKNVLHVPNNNNTLRNINKYCVRHRVREIALPAENISTTLEILSELLRKIAFDKLRIWLINPCNEEAVKKILSWDLPNYELPNTPVDYMTLDNKRWTQMTADISSCCVNVPVASEEGSAVITFFNKTIGKQIRVQKIERVQNKYFYKQYVIKKEHLKENYSSKHPLERTLFHGSDDTAVRYIVDNGFDKGYMGKNATKFGKGNYFATSASYSDKFSRGSPKKMIIAKVLTGKFCQGAGAMIEPNKGCNSAVDNVRSPGMFIVFRDSDAYAQYIFTYI